MAVPVTKVQEIKIFAATWNVGGKTPDCGLNLEDFLQVEDSSDLYVLGFQEIVPLSAGNVLVTEDTEPAKKWLALINRSLNNGSICSSEYSAFTSKQSENSINSKSNFFGKPSLNDIRKNIRADSNYLHIASKQMVGIFLTVWARKELVRHIGHLRISTLRRGIMGCLGNKGCVSISLTLHQTSFCFICSHLASGEKDGDEVKRNVDVAQILKNTRFPKICKHSHRIIPQRISDHERIIWVGDLNYRVSLSYEKARLLLKDNEWNALLKKDQLNMEREAGRVFRWWNEGKIFFAPTYKYSNNSDSYVGETVKSKKKRRTPSWCDRILWHGSGIEQLCYKRGESRFSDHRPVCAVFAVEVEMNNNNNTSRFMKALSCKATTIDFDNCLPRSHTFYEY